MILSEHVVISDSIEAVKLTTMDDEGGAPFSAILKAIKDKFHSLRLLILDIFFVRVMRLRIIW